MKPNVKYKDMGLKALVENTKVLKELGVLVGYIPPMAAVDHGGINMATLAAIMEYGTDDIPARPFLSSFYREYANQIKELWSTETSKVYMKKKDPLEAVTDVAKGMASLALKRFDTASAWAIPLDPKTVERKGSSTPLVDTGALRAHLGWAVTKKRSIVRFGRAE